MQLSQDVVEYQIISYLSIVDLYKIGGNNTGYWRQQYIRRIKKMSHQTPEDVDVMVTFDEEQLFQDVIEIKKIQDTCIDIDRLIQHVINNGLPRVLLFLFNRYGAMRLTNFEFYPTKERLFVFLDVYLQLGALFVDLDMNNAKYLLNIAVDCELSELDVFEILDQLAERNLLARPIYQGLCDYLTHLEIIHEYGVDRRKLQTIGQHVVSFQDAKECLARSR